MRTLPQISRERQIELEFALEEPYQKDDRKRLRAMELVVKHRDELNAGKIAEEAETGRATLFRWLKAFKEGGVKSLLERRHTCGRDLLLKRMMAAERMQWNRMRAKVRAAVESQCGDEGMAYPWTFPSLDGFG